MAIDSKKVRSIYAATEKLAKKEKLPDVVLDTIEKNTRSAPPSQRNKELFDLLQASKSGKEQMVKNFMKNAIPRLEKIFEIHKLRSAYFGFKSMRMFIDDLELKLLNMGTKAENLGGFSKKSKIEGRKMAFIGRYLFEPYVLNGPFSVYIKQTSELVLSEINSAMLKEIKQPEKYYIMRDVYNLPCKVESPFEKLIPTKRISIQQLDKKGNEIIKESIDYGPFALNKEGMIIMPLPADIKLVAALKKATKQHIEFINKLRNAIDNKQNVIVQVEKDYAAVLKDRLGEGKVMKMVDSDLYTVELAPGKIVFDMSMRNQAAITPDPSIWKGVKTFQISTVESDIGIDMITTAKGERFNYWVITVPVNMEPFEDIYRALFE